MKVLIVGAGGMLGSYVRDSFCGHEVVCVDIDVNAHWIQYGDIRDYNQMKNIVNNQSPDLILNLAALTDLEYCEKNEENCFSTNTIGAIHLQDLAKVNGSEYVFISTAGIFDGKKDIYTDFDEPIPLSLYGRSKFYAERYLTHNYEKTWIFRAGWMMGGGQIKDKKFVNKFLDQVRKGRKIIEVVDDKLGTPTYTKDFANSIYRHTTEKLPYGLYNMVSKGEASRFDAANKIVKILNLDVEVKKVDSDFFKNEYFATRPASEKLVNQKLNDLGVNYMRDWEICLEDYLLNDYKFNVQ